MWAWFVPSLGMTDFLVFNTVDWLVMAVVGYEFPASFNAEGGPDSTKPCTVCNLLWSPGRSHGQRPRRRPRRGIQRSRRPRHSTSRRSRDSSWGSPLKAQAARVMGHTISMRSATLIAAYGEGSRSPSLPSHSCDRPWDVLSRELPRACVSTVSGAGRGDSIAFILPRAVRRSAMT